MILSLNNNENHVSGCLVPLDLLGPGDEAVIEDVHGDAQWVDRMAELGIRSGCRLRLVQPGNPCLIDVCGSRLCVRGDDILRILVRVQP